MAVPSGQDEISRRTSTSVYSISPSISPANRSIPYRSAMAWSARSPTEQAATWAPRSPNSMWGTRTLALMSAWTSSTGRPCL